MAMNSLEPIRELQSIEMESTTQFVIPKPHTLNGLPVELILSISDLLEREVFFVSPCAIVNSSVRSVAKENSFRRQRGPI
ncbi:hypothetical protein N7536_009886 [Penicillium majusculum]|nr:hypothetical protein N7536_009886 [Penicillium majusculum]